MAPRRKRAGAKGRQAKNAESKAAAVHSGGEITPGPASAEEPQDELPVVHHKKFGEIRVQQEEQSLEGMSCPAMVNGSVLAPPVEVPERSAVYQTESNVPLDGPIVVSQGPISSDNVPDLEKPPVYFDDTLEDQSIEYMTVLKGIERLGSDSVEQVTDELETSQIDVPQPVNSVDSSPSRLNESEPYIKVDQDNKDDEGEGMSDAADMKLEYVGGPEEEDRDEEAVCPSPLPASASIRRSTRIRHIGILKQKERGVAGSPDPEKPVKVKSRWRRSSELEMHSGEPITGLASHTATVPDPETEDQLQERLERERRDAKEGLRTFISIQENEYRTERNACREAKRMTCDCVLSKEEIERGERGCGEDCLNRMLFLECGQRCALGERCSNKCFQKKSYADCKIFKTDKKGYGLKAEKPIPASTFIMEYVGEVVDQKEFHRRVKSYAKDDVKHFYFMALKGDTIIDATSKGNISRFINHSCDPNAETQKWTVNGELRIGFFTKRNINTGEEITFDYRFQRYGKEAQKCYCEAPNCRGWIGENPDDESEEESDEESEEEVDEDAEKAKADSDMEIESPEVKPEPKPKIKRVRKPRTPAEKKEGRMRGRGRRKQEPVVEDLGLEEELQRLSITGLKNRAHTLMLSRLMVRAEDWATRSRLLHLISTGDEPCRRLFLDYHGLRFLHAWMQNTVSDPTDRQLRRLEILKTLQTLPIPHKTMLLDSKVLAMLEDWSGTKKLAPTLSPDGDSGESEDTKPKSEGDVSPSEDKESSPNDSPMPEPPKAEPEDTHSTDLKDELTSEVTTLTNTLLEAWLQLKEVFKIPKKERIEQMKEHEREADRGYRQSVVSREHLDKIYSRYKLDRLERDRERDRDRDKDRDRKRHRESPSSNDPDWLKHSRRMTKHERRQLFALQVLREDEAARQRMQQEELWSQHKARCEALGLDPTQHPAMDPISGCPIFFDQNTRTWSPTPPYATYQYHPHAQQHLPGYSQVPNGLASNALPYPMVTYVNGPYPTPSPSIHMTPVYQTTPRYPAPQNIITLTPDPPLPETSLPTSAEVMPSPDAPVLTQVPLNTPMKLPPKWKAAKDARGYVYYYHVKERKSQWEPPSWTENEARAEAERALAAEDESSSESSETESEEEDEDVQKEETAENETDEDVTVSGVVSDAADTTQPEEDSGDESNPNQEAEAEAVTSHSPIEQPSQSDAAMEVETSEGCGQESESGEVASIAPSSKPAPKTKRRVGLVQERIISPSYESGRPSSKEYKAMRLKIKKRKEERRAEKIKLKEEKLRERKKKTKRDKRVTSAAAESSTDKKIKENFKLNIVGAIVSHLNSYRKPDCKVGRITSNDDFKHLARKLTHFVMLKELKHCQSVDDLQCNDSVRVKARDFIKKYMAKFGPEYERDHEKDPME